MKPTMISDFKILLLVFTKRTLIVSLLLVSGVRAETEH
jgi:hypothetical protein